MGPPPPTNLQSNRHRKKWAKSHQMARTPKSFIAKLKEPSNASFSTLYWLQKETREAFFYERKVIIPSPKDFWCDLSQCFSYVKDMECLFIKCCMNKMYICARFARAQLYRIRSHLAQMTRMRFGSLLRICVAESLRSVFTFSNLLMTSSQRHSKEKFPREGYKPFPVKRRNQVT